MNTLFKKKYLKARAFAFNRMYFNSKLNWKQDRKSTLYSTRISQFEKKMVKNIIFREQLLFSNYQSDDSRKDWKTLCSNVRHRRMEGRKGGLMRGRVENRRWSKREGRVISFERLNSTFHALSRLFIARQQVNAYISGVRV